MILRRTEDVGVDGQRLLKLCKDTYSHVAPGVASKSGTEFGTALVQEACWAIKLRSHTLHQRLLKGTVSQK